MSDTRLNLVTRDCILDLAEGQFMEHGCDVTPMRMISRAANVNLAAVNYHFISRKGLFREVFRHRLIWLNTERLVEIDALEQQANGLRGRSVFLYAAAHWRD